MSQRDLLAVLGAKPADAGRPEGAMTTVEIGEALGWDNKRVLRFLRPLVSSGQIEVVQISLPAITGVLTKRPAYRLVKPENDTAVPPTPPGNIDSHALNQ